MINSHVEGHVVGGAILVCICDVVDCTYSHDDLSQRVHDGQVNNSSVQKGEERLNRRSSCSDRDKIDEGQKSKDEM